MPRLLPASKLQDLAERRDTDPAHLVSQVRGDLDWIVLKATEKNRVRRYQTANSLAMDVMRFLEFQPVSARQQYPLSSIEPSLEAAAVFRALGDWNAGHGRLDQAMQCFSLLIQANRLDDPTRILNGTDLMATAAAMRQHDGRHYDDFRREVLERYAAPASALHAEHLLKTCLLRDADEWTMGKLAHVAEVLGEPSRAPFPSWAGLSLALYHLRSEHYEDAAKACATGLQDKRIKHSCRASILAVRAMIEAETGAMKQARKDIAAASALVEDCKGGDFIEGKPIAPVWYDWEIAKVLIDEAEAMAEGAAGK